MKTIKGQRKIKRHYQTKELVHDYEKERFSSLIGSLIDQEEKIFVKEILGQLKPGKILEIGAGTGRITQILPKKN